MPILDPNGKGLRRQATGLSLDRGKPEPTTVDVHEDASRGHSNAWRRGASLLLSSKVTQCA